MAGLCGNRLTFQVSDNLYKINRISCSSLHRRLKDEPKPSSDQIPTFVSLMLTSDIVSTMRRLAHGERFVNRNRGQLL
jgi:hypothetical protein